jgi:hypothetical protein
MQLFEAWFAAACIIEPVWQRCSHWLCLAVSRHCRAVVFWGGPLWQVYVGLRTHACTVTVKGLRPATATEVERMHNDCAICWCPMTTPGADRSSPAGAAGDVDGDHTATGAAPALAGSDDDSSAAGPSAGASAPPAAPGDAAGSGAATGALVLDQQGPAGPETAGGGGRGGVQGRSGVDLADSDGSTLPCGHCYHQTCLTQVCSCAVELRWPSPWDMLHVCYTVWGGL